MLYETTPVNTSEVYTKKFLLTDVYPVHITNFDKISRAFAQSLCYFYERHKSIQYHITSQALRKYLSNTMLYGIVLPVTCKEFKLSCFTGLVLICTFEIAFATCDFYLWYF